MSSIPSGTYMIAERPRETVRRRIVITAFGQVRGCLFLHGPRLHRKFAVRRIDDHAFAVPGARLSSPWFAPPAFGFIEALQVRLAVRRPANFATVAQPAPGGTRDEAGHRHRGRRLRCRDTRFGPRA